ncbi:MAG: membrane protein insertase YidC [Planctomycetaceae bacterium]|nr:membrane protein insertase YidC [Planctomycetaceae bacterium]
MDQQRRLLIFTVFSFLILFGWMNIGPKWFPGMFPAPKPIQKQDAKKEDEPAEPEKDANPPKADPPEAVLNAKLPDHPTKPIVIGSDKPETGYGLKVTLSSVGAGVVSAELNDSRYKALKARQLGAVVPQLSLLGNDLDELKPLATAPPVTGQLAIDAIDKKLKKLDRDANLARLNWEVVAEEVEAAGEAKGVTKSVTFGLKTPDGVWDLRKKYQIRRWEKADAKRDEDPTGYQLTMQLSFSNLSSEEQTVVYDLQGPAGLPLENAENASKFRDVKFGFREKDGDLVTNALTSNDIVKASDKGKIENLVAGDRTFQYVGLDTQYFTVLFLPQDVARRDARLLALAEEASKESGEKITVADLMAGSKDVPDEQAAQAKELLAQPASYLDFAKPQVVEKNAALPAQSEVSVRFHSTEQVVPAESEITHEYLVYLGPKRATLLGPPPLEAGKVIDFSGFLIIPASMVAGIAGFLLWILNGFHGVGLPYGICIMLLTVLVRSCMFPISKKQAMNAKRMKEIQPRLAELKAKYPDDKQKFAEEQMKLFAETGFNPLSGCLPVLMQLPIFIGLYQALSSSVDLRRAPFLWFDNLAAPDALVFLPFKMPFLGNEFNLLPIITTSLFLFQQKMLMPPPTDEQTRMQAKVFFWMTLMMGFMFYHVPAGLCVYFIASSVWSMGERKLLDRMAPPAPPVAKNVSGPNGGAGKPANNFWSKMRSRLEEMGEMQDVNGIPSSGQRRPRDKGKKNSRP